MEFEWPRVAAVVVAVALNCEDIDSRDVAGYWRCARDQNKY